MDAVVVSRSGVVGIAELLHERKGGGPGCRRELKSCRVSNGFASTICRFEGGSDMLARNGKDAGNN